MSQPDNSDFHEYLDIITDKLSTPNDKAFYFMQLLRETDGASSGENIITIKGPKLPRGFTPYQLIERLSSQTQLIKISRPGKVRTDLISWASGAKTPRFFKNKNIAKFFQKLFFNISTSFNDITLDRLNLFHAHLIKDNRVYGGDLVMVIHAFEYPLDLEPKKNRDAIIFDTTLGSFSTNASGFKTRNLFWSLRKNTVWRVDTSKESIFNHLVRSPAFAHYPEEVLRANTAQENYFGKIVGDLNFFPKELKEPFVTRGAGNPPADHF